MAAGVAAAAAIALIVLRRRRIAATAAAADAVASLTRDADALMDAAHAALADARSHEGALDALGKRLGTADQFVDAPSAQPIGPPPSPSAGRARVAWPIAVGRAELQRIGSTESLVDLSAFETPPEGGPLPTPTSATPGLADDESVRELLLASRSGLRASSGALATACQQADKMLAQGQPAQQALALLNDALPQRLAADPTHMPTLRALGLESSGRQEEGPVGGAGAEGTQRDSHAAGIAAAGKQAAGPERGSQAPGSANGSQPTRGSEAAELRLWAAAALVRVCRCRLALASHQQQQHQQPHQPHPQRAGGRHELPTDFPTNLPDGTGEGGSSAESLAAEASATGSAPGSAEPAAPAPRSALAELGERQQHVADALSAAACAVALCPASGEAHVAKAWAHLAAATLAGSGGGAAAAAAGLREQMCARPVPRNGRLPSALPPASSSQPHPVPPPPSPRHIAGREDALDAERHGRTAAQLLPAAPQPRLALGAAAMRTAQLAWAKAKARAAMAAASHAAPSCAGGGSPGRRAGTAFSRGPSPLSPKSRSRLSPAELPAESARSADGGAGGAAGSGAAAVNGSGSGSGNGNGSGAVEQPMSVRVTLADARTHFEAACKLCAADGTAAPASQGGAPLASCLVWLAKACLALGANVEAADALARARALPASCAEVMRAQAAAAQLERHAKAVAGSAANGGAAQSVRGVQPLAAPQQ